MQMTVCPLFSGSSGNSVYLSCGGVRLLVDAGVSAARVEANAARNGVNHERDRPAYSSPTRHVDHVRRAGACSAAAMACRLCQRGHLAGHPAKGDGIPARCVRTFCTGEDFYIGSVNVRPFAIPHDAAEPVGFAFDCRGLRCGVATDIGHIDESWLRAVSGCQALVLEANHDVEMVKRGAYPQRLKQRILGRRGHLCNEDCAKALLRLASEGTRAVYLSHLSADNNLPELAYNTVCGALSDAGFAVDDAIRVMVSRRDRVSDMLVLRGGVADAV